MRAAAKMAAATKIQNNFGKYLQYAMDSSEIIILKNGKQVAGIVSEEASISFLTDFFVGYIITRNLKDFTDGKAMAIKSSESLGDEANRTTKHIKLRCAWSFVTSPLWGWKRKE